MPSAPVYCGHPVPPAEPEMWVSWQYVLDILLEELNTFSDIFA